MKILFFLFKPESTFIISILAFIGWIVFFSSRIGDLMWLNLLRFFFEVCISVSIGIAIGHSLIGIMKPKWHKEIMKGVLSYSGDKVPFCECMEFNTCQTGLPSIDCNCKCHPPKKSNLII